MGKNIGANGFVHAFLPAFLLLQIATLAQARVDIFFYAGTNGCGSSGYACTGVTENQCCGLSGWSAGSVKVTATVSPSCLGFHVYRNGYCTYKVFSSYSGNQCVSGGGGQYTGSRWFNSCTRRRSLLAEVECNEAAATAANCTKLVEPNGVAFTEDGQKGDWILEGSNVTELYSRLINVHDGEKVNWLKSQGATFNELHSALTLDNLID